MQYSGPHPRGLETCLVQAPFCSHIYTWEKERLKRTISWIYMYLLLSCILHGIFTRQDKIREILPWGSVSLHCFGPQSTASFQSSVWDEWDLTRYVIHSWQHFLLWMELVDEIISKLWELLPVFPDETFPPNECLMFQDELFYDFLYECVSDWCKGLRMPSEVIREFEGILEELWLLFMVWVGMVCNLFAHFVLAPPWFSILDTSNTHLGLERLKTSGYVLSLHLTSPASTFNVSSTWAPTSADTILPPTITSGASNVTDGWQCDPWFKTQVKVVASEFAIYKMMN